MAFPGITPLYNTHGFVWYRLWARPLVPDIEALPLEERAYYQDFMCTTPHNPNNVDLSRDVLFQLTTTEHCRKAMERMDACLWAPLEQAITHLERAREAARGSLGRSNVIEDQYIRARALRCWFRTQHSVAAWIVGVHGYMESAQADEQERHRALLRHMIDREIENSEELMRLLRSDVAFMASSEPGETPLMYAANLADSMSTRIRLMREHRDDEPSLDPAYMERQSGILTE